MPPLPVVCTCEPALNNKSPADKRTLTPPPPDATSCPTAEPSAVWATAEPLMGTRLTTTDTVSTVKPEVSVTKAPPLPADNDKVSNEVSSGSVLLPTAPLAPVVKDSPEAVTSKAVSPSITEPPATTATNAVLVT